jgi:hypothetical protein
LGEATVKSICGTSFEKPALKEPSVRAPIPIE